MGLLICWSFRGGSESSRLCTDSGQCGFRRTLRAFLKLTAKSWSIRDKCKQKLILRFSPYRIVYYCACTGTQCVQHHCGSDKSTCTICIALWWFMAFSTWNKMQWNKSKIFAKLSKVNNFEIPDCGQKLLVILLYILVLLYILSSVINRFTEKYLCLDNCML